MKKMLAKFGIGFLVLGQGIIFVPATVLAEVTDATPPVTTASCPLLPGGSYPYCMLALSSTDDGTVAYTEYSMDNQATWITYGFPVLFNTPGEYTVFYRSADAAGNLEIAKSIQISIGIPVPTFIPVAIDIKPGSSVNSVNLGSNGVIPVAILGSAAVDVKQIDISTVRLANASIKTKGNGQAMAEYSDINKDGFTDVTVKILTDALSLSPSDEKADLDGFLKNGTEIKGSDFVRIVPQ